ncbi:hypothetical protein [Streptomyces sp. NPDC002676]
MDEFAFRKGCPYGTVLVDAEAGRGMDVLPDRTSDLFAAWLTGHPGAEGPGARPCSVGEQPGGIDQPNDAVAARRSSRAASA